METSDGGSPVCWTPLYKSGILSTQAGRHSTGGGKYGSFWLTLQPSQGLRFRRFQGAEWEQT